MAIAPLILQTPRQSLIGGKELPKASGTGVPTPDIVNPIARMADDLERKANENDQLKSTIEGQRYAESERQAGVDAGLGPDGMYRELAPIPRGDRYFQLAYFNTRAQNAASDIRTGVSQRFNEIQSNFEDSTETRIALMQSYAEGMIQSLDPLLREQARSDAAQEIEARTKQMFNRDEELRWKATTDGIKTRIEDGFSKALSASSSTADPTPHLDQVYKAIDDQVRLGIVAEATATKQKEQITQAVGAVGEQAQISKAILKGDVDIDAAEKFVLEYKVGGDATLEVNEIVPGSTQSIPSPGSEPETIDTSKVNKKTYSTKDLKARFTDPDVAQAMAVKLQEVVNFKQEWMRRKEADTEYLNALAGVSGTDNQLPSAFRDDQEKVLARMIVSGKMDTPEGMSAAVQITEASKVVSPSMRNWMIDAVNGSDFKKAMTAIQVWNRISTVKQGARDVGNTVRASMSAEDVATLDQASAFADLSIRSGDQNSEQRWAENQKELIRDDKSVSDAIGAFNTEAETNSLPNFQSQVLTKFSSDYGNGDMPREMLDQVKVAYRLYAASPGKPTRVEALDQAWEAVKNNWQKGDIFYNGYQPNRDPLANPPGYGQKITSKGVVNQNDPSWGIPRWSGGHAWANDYSVHVLGGLDDAGALVFNDPNGIDRQTFDQIMANPNRAFASGANHFTLKAMRGDRQYTQFNVVMTMGDGSEQILRTRDAQGNAVPVVLDIALVNAHLMSKAKGQEANKAFWEVVGDKRTELLDKQYVEVNGPSWPETMTTKDWDAAQIKKFVEEQPEEFQQQYKDLLESSDDAYQKVIEQNRLKEVVVPEGVDIAPGLLQQSKVAGPEATIAAIQQIDSVLPMPDGGQFLLNVAAAESNFGRHPESFRASGDRGIFQINDGTQGAYREMVRRARIEGDPINVAAAKLKPLGVDVANLVPSDLEKPIVSAALARLYFMADQRPYPKTTEEQAAFWKDHYNTSLGAGTVAGFIAAADKVLMPNKAYASTMPLGEGSVTDMQGNANPANFLSTKPHTQSMAMLLSASFGKPLRVTPHGGTQADARSGTSQHHHGTALDIYVADMSDAEKKRLIVTAIALGYKGIGGYGAGAGKGTLHLDLRAKMGNGPQGVAAWWRHKAGVDSGFSTGPAWFAEAINEGAAALAERRG